MRCGKPEHQPGQKCAAKNAKCKECHKIGHFHKVCQSRKRGRRAHLVQTTPQNEQDTHINENGVRQPNPPMFRGKKYLNTFIVTNTNDCSNLLSHGATFRMGVLLPNYPEENVVKGENVPSFMINTSTDTSLNVFQILQDL